MLSILIPVYNWDCSRLISDLHSQGIAKGMQFELIVADDHSTKTEITDKIRETVSRLEKCRLIALEKNIGRSAIRNLLAENAEGQKLLFMDCDAEVCSTEYLSDYMKAASSADVVCGGVKHPEMLPRNGVELRWKYEKKADKIRSAECRGRNPYSRFTPFNFLISRDVFQSIRFSTEFTGYGYEDVLFGLELEKRGVSIIHIDNPLLHLGLEDNAVFLSKTENALRNLSARKEELEQGSTLLHHYSNICRLHLEPLLRTIATLSINGIRQNLLSILTPPIP